MKQYKDEFYEKQAARPLDSMLKILRIMQHYIPKICSVIDFGCGTGHWLAAAKKLGIGRVLGLDIVEYKDDWMMIQKDEYMQWDLADIVEDVGARFDLALCLEVAEHLPPSRADTLIQDLTNHSEYVLFSAAIPGQGGTGHMNERWQSYWVERFAKQYYKCLDCVRWEIWDDADVPPWYKQNILLFVARQKYRVTNLEYERMAPVNIDANRIVPFYMNPQNVVHPHYYKNRIKNISQSTEPIKKGIQNVRSSLHMPFRKTEEMLEEEKKQGRDVH